MSAILVHKRTLGVLQWYWDGVSYLTFDGVERPKMAPVTLESHGLTDEEWWQVANGTPLARKIALSYPFFDPVEAGGQLVDVIPWPAWKRYGEEEPPAAPKPTCVRGGKYNRRRSERGA